MQVGAPKQELMVGVVGSSGHSSASSLDDSSASKCFRLRWKTRQHGRIGHETSSAIGPHAGVQAGCGFRGRRRDGVTVGRRRHGSKLLDFIFIERGESSLQPTHVFCFMTLVGVGKTPRSLSQLRRIVTSPKRDTCHGDSQCNMLQQALIFLRAAQVTNPQRRTTF